MATSCPVGVFFFPFFFVEAETIFDAGLVPANDKYGSGLKAQNFHEPACKRLGRPEKQTNL